MERHRLAWALSLPIAVAGSLTAHALAYDLVGPADPHGPELHGYLDHTKAALALGFLVGVGGLVASGMRRSYRRPPAWLFGVVPLVGFGVQEHVERAVHLGVFPLGTALEPTFLVGLVLQVPFALAALLVAWTLLALGEAIGHALACGPAPSVAMAPAARVPVPAEVLPHIPALARGHGERGPPRPLPA